MTRSSNMATSASKLKIGLVLDDGLDKPDGVQQYILAIGVWLKTQGHDVRYLVGQTTRTDIDGVHSLARNVNVRSNGNRLSVPLPTNRAKLKQFLHDEQFDVLHVQTPYSPFMGEQLILLAGPRTAIVGTFHILPHSTIFGLATKVLGLLSFRSLKRFDTMLSVSSAAQVFAKKTYGIESTVLPNVIDYSRFHDAKPFPKYDNKTLTILFLGRLVPRKGAGLLITAVAKLAGLPTIPKFRVVICGRGPLEANLRKQIAQCGLEDVIELTGFVEEADKPRFYSSADIAVFPSSGGESFGIVLLEAMASGKAVVLAGDNPGYHSVMEPQLDLLFEPRNADRLAQKLAYYLAHKHERQVMAAWGEVYTEDFDVAVVGKQLLDVYRQVLHNRRAT